ncbi:MAG: methyltransferase domain-containing protein [Acidobacteriota bacterium]|nr:methyltransferase domain-containing protein [Acidobacteriota bacterium]
MNLNLLDILRCPFCGSRLEMEEGESLEQDGEEVANGIVFCQCSAYPVVAGIPVFTADYLADSAREHLAKGEREQALLVMLSLDDEARQTAFRSFIEKGGEASYQEGVDVLCPDAEGTYFIYRFSDPTFVVGSTLLRAVGSDARCWTKRAIDLCGGSGHLTRVLCEAGKGAEVVLADAYFWKLWLAKQITAPDCQPVCCDANNPLPFARDAFSLAVCSDAFHYIWSKRLLSGEMMRIAGEGVVVLSHIHNALAENYSAGMPLAPEWWRNLFAELNPRLFKESEVFESVMMRQPVDLSRKYCDEDLKEEAALSLIATKLDGLFRVYEQASASEVSGVLCVNPLYKIEQKGETAVLKLEFPSPEYEEEFGGCKRYLPERVEVSAEVLKESSAVNGEVQRLIERRVLLDLPSGYLGAGV